MNSKLLYKRIDEMTLEEINLCQKQLQELIDLFGADYPESKQNSEDNH